MKKRAWWIWLLVSLVWGTSASAQYVVGPGDVLQVTVWKESSLDRQVRVREDGYFTFPPVGDVEAVGLTTENLASRLEEQLFTFTRSTTRVTITVVEFNSKYVILSGAVNQPGRYAFEIIPSLPRVIGLAGGATPGARLSEVSIVRTIGAREEVLRVNLSQFLESGNLEQVPELKPGDVVNVPGSVVGDQALQPGVAAPGPGTISILGAVGRPGTYPVETSFALPEVLGLAGGLRPDADLRKISVLSREPDGSEFVATLDLEAIFYAGEPVSYPIRPGDALYIHAREPSVLGQVGRGVLTAMSLSRDILNFVLLWDVLKDDNSTNTRN